MQLLDLYDRFPVVKEYYDFVFNPKEDKLLHAAKAKIANEYFPIKRKKPKARRSIAQKYIKQFITLGVEPHLIADFMLFNLETSQEFSINKNLPDSFFKSMLNSFVEAVHFISVHGLLDELKDRVVHVYETTQEHNWRFSEDFSKAIEIFE